MQSPCDDYLSLISENGTPHGTFYYHHEENNHMLVIFTLITENKNQMKATEPRAWLDKNSGFKKKVLAIKKEF